MSEEQTSSLGQTLKAARIKKGLTIDDVQQTTKIQKRYLMAIEDENFDALPGDFYVRAFIKQYADTVGLDGTELLKTYDHDLPSTQTQAYVDQVNENNPETRTAQRRVDDRYNRLRRAIPIAIIVAVVVVVLVGIWLAAARSGRQTAAPSSQSSSVSVSGTSHQSSSSSQSSKKPVTKKPAVTLKQTASTADGATWVMKSAPKTKTVKFTSTGQAWSSVVVNGQTVWQGIVTTAGKTVTLPAGAKTATLNLGNAPMTKIAISGHALKVKSTATTQASSSSAQTTTPGTSTADGTQTTQSSSAQTTGTNTVQTLTVQFE